MTHPSGRRPHSRRSRFETFRRVATIVAGMLGMLAVILFLGDLFLGEEGPEYPPALTFDSTLPPIASEAGMFQVRPEELGLAPTATRDTAAHARTLEFFRTIREFPGGPPRIPHGLTREEFRTQACLNCHRRGGFVPRFGDYARVTPHPEFTQCLQCHVPRDTLVGIRLPRSEAEPTCDQCHVDPDEELPIFVPMDWRTMAWPDTGQRAHPEAPYLIPHSFHLRTRCVACHVGPDAVMGIRTDHPERTACRQCHLPVEGPASTTDWPRTVNGGPAPAGGGP